MKSRAALLLGAMIGAATIATTAPAAVSSSSATQTRTVVGVAAGDARFSTLVALVKQAGLVNTLNGKGPFTVFAPTNAAFAKLKRTAPDTYAAVASDSALLRKVLTYHVLGKRVPSTAAIAVAKKKGSVKTVQGEPIKLSLMAGKLRLNGTSTVVVADVKASNGVIHALNAVMVPPSAS